ncbi:hypothetical protein AB4K20DRAFT_1869231 [Rhizopus microsporus]|uniref:Uncharacterized protein n=1 Tax=Rhizopus microsporus TaxID=58291 RepID=A0A1X0RSD7_RHIZD|nr:hypothetical protein BCV71DRAFT_237943 [Rhizopus microsporus]
MINLHIRLLIQVCLLTSKDHIILLWSFYFACGEKVRMHGNFVNIKSDRKRLKHNSSGFFAFWEMIVEHQSSSRRHPIFFLILAINPAALALIVYFIFSTSDATAPEPKIVSSMELLLILAGPFGGVGFSILSRVYVKR